tara:strand:+ start:53 stop:298 length:246 start_codon:yes stop_codon:yes gene_type:complete
MDHIKFHPHHVEDPFIYAKGQNIKLKMNIKKLLVTHHLIQGGLRKHLIDVQESKQVGFVALLFSKIATAVGVHQEEFGGDE